MRPPAASRADSVADPEELVTPGDAAVPGDIPIRRLAAPHAGEIVAPDARARLCPHRFSLRRCVAPATLFAGGTPGVVVPERVVLAGIVRSPGAPCHGRIPFNGRAIRDPVACRRAASVRARPVIAGLLGRRGRGQRRARREEETTYPCRYVLIHGSACLSSDVSVGHGTRRTYSAFRFTIVRFRGASRKGKSGPVRARGHPDRPRPMPSKARSRPSRNVGP